MRLRGVGFITNLFPPIVVGPVIMLIGLSLAGTGVDMGDTRNLVIASLILILGIGGAELTLGGITIGGIGLAALVGVILNLILPRSK